MGKQVVKRNGKLALVKPDSHTKKTIALATATPLGGIGLALLTSVAFGTTVFIPIIIFMSLFVTMNLVKQNVARETRAESHDIADEEFEVDPVEKLINSREAPIKRESEYDCPNYEQVTFELKLVDEGVISIQDVSICEYARLRENHCLLCQPIAIRMKKDREACEAAERAERQREYEKMLFESKKRSEARATESDNKQLGEMTAAEAKRVMGEHQKWLDTTTKNHREIGLCPKHAKNSPVWTWFGLSCPKCSLASLKERDENDRLARVAAKKAAAIAAKAEKERLFEERRHVMLDGLQLYRPDAVPEGAVPSILHGLDIDPMATHSFIVWKWTEDGQNTKFYKQPVVVDALTVSSWDKGPVKTVYSTYDGEGNYLGDYSTLNGHLPKDRHENALKAHFKNENVEVELKKRVGDIEKWAWGENKPERLK